MSTKKVALITGANKGLGLEIARQLGQLGITVLIGSRSPKRGEASAAALRAAGLDAHTVTIDVTHAPSAVRAFAFIEHEYGKLDILVNNAGVMHEPTLKPADVPVDILRETFETNFLGVVDVTQTLLPLLRKSDAGRIVNVSSSLGSHTLHADPTGPFAAYQVLGYDASKSALNMFTIELAAQLRDTPIKVNSACPGWVKTDMGGPDAPGTVEQGADTPVWLATLPADGPTGGFFNSRKPVPW
jgi:NAD(P)-dependent dehydrogenase (short-subunit alcohol dehydrogenase family)